jgi:hypothetical protein
MKLDPVDTKKIRTLVRLVLGRRPDAIEVGRKVRPARPRPNPDPKPSEGYWDAVNIVVLDEANLEEGWEDLEGFERLQGLKVERSKSGEVELDLYCRMDGWRSLENVSVRIGKDGTMRGWNTSKGERIEDARMLPEDAVEAPAPWEPCKAPVDADGNRLMCWSIPPEAQGQPVEREYVIHDGTYYRRTHDRATRLTTYARRPVLDSDPEPWNGEPA